MAEAELPAKLQQTVERLDREGAAIRSIAVVRSGVIVGDRVVAPRRVAIALFARGPYAEEVGVPELQGDEFAIARRLAAELTAQRKLPAPASREHYAFEAPLDAAVESLGEAVRARVAIAIALFAGYRLSQIQFTPIRVDRYRQVGSDARLTFEPPDASGIPADVVLAFWSGPAERANEPSWSALERVLHDEARARAVRFEAAESGD